ncbi:MAG: hypothetical protein J4224_03525 [Candidatus Diapherotrites archaeon]|uniref:Uncharacterized protein n=1 Tax=Candidatus Iainarchaeum sp. TaxID=3101447 RepID=A0A7J4IW96_9ARCH|nr:hypothetical protein [Candidatus Diapherotrites archaeon]HIH08525.1 hypothetical protein [Candidatus Diapherotrites archaeon]
MPRKMRLTSSKQPEGDFSKHLKKIWIGSFIQEVMKAKALSPEEARIAHQGFARKKSEWRASLRKALRGKGGSDSIQPIVRNSVVKLNQFPFVYTWDSFRDRLFIRKPSLSWVSIQEARKLKELEFSSSFITFSVDPASPRSVNFMARLLQWCDRFPDIKVLGGGKTVDLVSQTRETRAHFSIRGSEVDKRLAESKRFWMEFEKFLDGFAKEGK